MAKKDFNQLALDQAKEFGGKLSVVSKVPIETRDDLSIAYTPGVGAVSSAIAKDKSLVYDLTTKKNTVAVISDGSAVLGLGNIGAEAAMPVMEGKAALFKRFAKVDSIPIVLDTQDTEEIIAAVKAVAPTFGGINLEDISAPRCFEIEARLIEELDIPVFHDDQHGTAIVVLAALYNALKVAGKDIGDIRVVVNGGGSAGLSVARRFLAAGVKHIMVVDKVGILAEKNADQLPPHHAAIAKITNHENRTGTLEDALQGADVFVGVSAPHVLKPEWINTMADKPIIFAMANPEPEIFPDEALAAGAYIVGTGRSDFANQINNVLAFPCIFRGALDARARKITIDMQIAAAKGIASLIPDAELSTTNIIPNAFDGDVAEVVAESVRHAAEATAEA
ncbi:NADP-dependent malic enzyme [Lacticaseibacillus paracasei]|jgi:malate dehydrogenase (oxaloacetate-decarboxylating)|uniref:Malate oxidoreductase n=4 Tax=Lacticaseibacillus paracasei TaxID=1597 RepID=A0A829HAS5_LACPA|nr:NADP-dependent malic enzyme [Lacticaseibacillus paracasei]EKQ18273.1 NAD-dependent malic enzyme [Lacticaseibacillus casei UW4]EPC22315.1 NAD-dependent malic enzyme [Lacticaseibacillus paracasei subsp. paracasei Lpp22]EPC75266.1 malate oxidoreductase [Lacticaseibacillus paracasei subsp. paracasei Lpp41]OJF73260.1 malate dehydrogenase [Lacticaseibacillus casei]MBB1167180.1 NADP-dependent malic enzyme [Lacticaseibacillus paracasei]